MPHSAELLQRTGWTRPSICQHHKYAYCPSNAITNVVTNRILLRKSDSCVYTRTSQIPHKFICSSRFTPRILHCHNMSYSSWGQPQEPAATALPPTAEEDDEEDAAAMTGAQSDDSDSSAYSVGWERMEYLRTHRPPVGYLDDDDELRESLDDELRERKNELRELRERRRELRERRREPPPEPPVMFKEPPPEAPAISAVTTRVDLLSHDVNSVEDYGLKEVESYAKQLTRRRVDLLSHDVNSVEDCGGGAEVQDWCDICSRYDRCECHDEALSCDGGPEDEEREWCEVCGRLDRCRCEATVTPPIKEPPPPPPKWMATGACQCYLCKKPTTMVEVAVKTRRIMVVEPGDLNYATDGVPWLVCSRCGVFRPFANATEESCLNVIGIECTYGESEWEAQQQEPARGSTE
jgi:hypothetical protein